MSSVIFNTTSSTIDDPITKFTLIAISICGIMLFLGLPVIIGALADDRGISESQLGLMTSLRTVAGFVASILASFLVTKVNITPLVRSGLVLLILANTMLIIDGVTYSYLTFFMIFSGFGGGLVYALTLSLLAGSQNTSRTFSILVFFQVLIGGVELFAFPLLSNKFGVAGIFSVLAAVSMLCLFLTRFIPNKRVPLANSDFDASITGQSFVGMLCLVAVFLFYIMIGAVWTFIERMGVSTGLSNEAVGTVLSVGNFLSLIASAIAFAMANRIGSSSALMLSLLTMTLTLTSMAFNLTPLAFLACIAAFFMMWSFIDIYQMSTISDFDHNGRLTAIFPAAQQSGLILGPVIVSIMINYDFGYPRVLLASAVATLSAFIIYGFAQSRIPAKQH